MNGDFQLQLRVAAAEVGKNRAQDELVGEARQGDAHAARRFIARLPRLVHRLMQGEQGVGGARQQLFARLRQMDAARAADEKRHADFCFQLFQPLTGGRGGNAELARGGGDAARSGDKAEEIELGVDAVVHKIVWFGLRVFQAVCG